ncbi:MAG TPA: hypothetical protein PLT37_09830 [Kiritimatiellia bacterium]|nr:hypothetical protein [Kiritimatiellia bacterium]HQG75572.1 hypothetical protein [Kiritimatiellia bacterium]
MADINFNCPHCGQNLNGPEEMASQTIDCPVCQQSFQIPGGIIEVPKDQMAPAGGRPAPAAVPSTNDDKGKTVRIELPPEFLAEPDKHIFKIKRIQH